MSEITKTCFHSICEHITDEYGDTKFEMHRCLLTSGHVGMHLCHNCNLKWYRDEVKE